MNIVDLGLVYRIEAAPGIVRIDMTMTTAACPMADMIVEQARAAVAAIVPDGTTSTSGWSGTRRGRRTR